MANVEIQLLARSNRNNSRGRSSLSVFKVREYLLIRYIQLKVAVTVLLIVEVNVVKSRLSPPNFVETESSDAGFCVTLHLFYDFWGNVRQKLVVQERRDCVLTSSNRLYIHCTFEQFREGQH